jgi:hypothetical protein
VALDGCCVLKPCDACMLIPSDTPQTHFAACKRSCSKSRTYGMALRTGPFRRTISLCGAPHVPDAVLLSLRPYRPHRVALGRGTLAPPDGCAAVYRSGNNPSVLAVLRRMWVRTLSKYLPTSRSILSALATNDTKLAFRTFARRDPMNNQFLRPTA